MNGAMEMPDEATAQYVLDREGDLWQSVGDGTWQCLTETSLIQHQGDDLLRVLGPLTELVPAAAVRAQPAGEERTRIAELEAELAKYARLITDIKATATSAVYLGPPPGLGEFVAAGSVVPAEPVTCEHGRCEPHTVNGWAPNWSYVCSPGPMVPADLVCADCDHLESQHEMDQDGRCAALIWLPSAMECSSGEPVRGRRSSTCGCKFRTVDPVVPAETTDVARYRAAIEKVRDKYRSMVAGDTMPSLSEGYQAGTVAALEMVLTDLAAVLGDSEQQ